MASAFDDIRASTSRPETVNDRTNNVLDGLKTGLTYLAAIADGAVNVPGLKSAANLAQEVVRTAQVSQNRRLFYG